MKKTENILAYFSNKSALIYGYYLPSYYEWYLLKTRNSKKLFFCISIELQTFCVFIEFWFEFSRNPRFQFAEFKSSLSSNLISSCSSGVNIIKHFLNNLSSKVWNLRTMSYSFGILITSISFFLFLDINKYDL